MVENFTNDMVKEKHYRVGVSHLQTHLPDIIITSITFFWTRLTIRQWNIFVDCQHK